MFDFNLDDVLTTPTQHRSEVDEENEKEFDLSGLTFEDNEEEEIQEEIDSALNPNPAPEIKLITEKQAYEGAEFVIGLIKIANEEGLSRLGKWKLKRKLGGNIALKKMQALFDKELEGEELTAKEKASLKKYTAHLKAKDEIDGIVAMSDERKESLTKSLGKHFYDKQISIGGKDSFWTELLISEGIMITQVLTM